MKLKFIFKGVVASTLAVGLFTGVGTVSSFAQSTEISSENYETDSGIVPYDMDIDRGSYSGTQFQTSYKLSSANGKNVNFYVNNTGNVAVKITINGSYAKTIQPGEDDYITAPVGIFASNYTFKAVPSPNGKISISYGIAQRDY